MNKDEVPHFLGMAVSFPRQRRGKEAQSVFVKEQ